MNRLRFSLPYAAFVGYSLAALSAQAGFHLWQVKEVFTNADDSVQFVEMFDSFGGENFVSGFKLTSNSDGVLKSFTFPASLVGDTTGHHMLIATTGFGSLDGGVTPTFTFDQGGVSGSFFNSHATNLTFTFTGSGDAMTFSGASLPKDGVHSLTDAGAVGFPPGTANIGSGVNSPTNFAGTTGSVNLPPPTGDYNGNHTVDAADYTLWRDSLGKSVTKGTEADGNNDGTINDADFTFWKSHFNNPAGAGGGGIAAAAPEPATIMLALAALAGLAATGRCARQLLR